MLEIENEADDNLGLASHCMWQREDVSANLETVQAGFPKHWEMSLRCRWSPDRGVCVRARVNYYSLAFNLEDSNLRWNLIFAVENNLMHEA